jgi:predicted HicB family RNase H-like nuclease
MKVKRTETCVKEKTVALQVRLPLEMYRDIAARAKKARRSLNAEIVYNLELFLGDKRTSGGVKI